MTDKGGAMADQEEEPWAHVKRLSRIAMARYLRHEGKIEREMAAEKEHAAKVERSTRTLARRYQVQRTRRSWGGRLTVALILVAIALLPIVLCQVLKGGRARSDVTPETGFGRCRQGKAIMHFW